MAKTNPDTRVVRTDTEPDKNVAVISPQVAAIAAYLDEDQTQDFGREDVSLPFLRILQSNSPEVKRGDPKQIENAREGDFINTATQQVYSGDAGVVLVPVAFTRSYTEWVPRDAGGGLARDWGTDGTILQYTTKSTTTGRDVLENGNEVVQAGQYYCLLVNPETGEWEPVVVALSSTQLKKSRRWNTMIDSLIVEHPVTKKRFKPAMFYMSYAATTVPENNKRGSWMGWEIKKAKPVVEYPNGAEIYLNARELRESILRGDVKAQAPDAGLASAAGDPHEPATDAGHGGDDEPY